MALNPGRLHDAIYAAIKSGVPAKDELGQWDKISKAIADAVVAEIQQGDVKVAPSALVGVCDPTSATATVPLAPVILKVT